MTTRERKLATFLASMVGLVGIFLLVNKVLLGPIDNLKAQLADKDQKISERLADIKAERDQVARIESLSPRLGKWQKISLPQGDPKPELQKAHLARLAVEYQQYLNKLLGESGIKARAVKPDAFDARTVPMFARNRPIFQTLAISIEAESDLRSLIKFMEGLYRDPILQQIKSFSVTSQRTSAALAIKMTVEVLLVDGAETHKDRGGIFAKFGSTDKEKFPNVLARGKDQYRDIATKNMFTPPRETTATDNTPPSESAEEVLTYVRLTSITYSHFYGTWVAQMHNLGNRDDSVLLVDAPLPSKSPYQQNKAKATPQVRSGGERPGSERPVSVEAPPPAPEPVQQWTVLDRFKNKVTALKIVRIEPLRVLFQTEEKYYQVRVGDALLTAMEEPLGKDDLKTLGLTVDRNEVLKQVQLVELAFSKDRNSYEARLINKDYKDEKKTLAVELLPEEFDPPDTWVVKDRFGSETIKMKAISVTKDRFVFKSDDKHYQMNAGGTLLEALAKPLTEDEIKALSSK